MPAWLDGKMRLYANLYLWVAWIAMRGKPRPKICRRFHTLRNIVLLILACIVISYLLEETEHTESGPLHAYRFSIQH